jgi:hypothetical protein
MWVAVRIFSSTFRQPLPGILSPVHAILGLRVRARAPAGEWSPIIACGMTLDLKDKGEGRVKGLDQARRRAAPISTGRSETASQEER